MERFKLLYDISCTLSSSLDLDKVLSDILALTIPNVGATSGSIIILEESEQARRHTLIRKEPAALVTEQTVGQILDKGLAGWVVQHKEGAIVFDTRDDERWLTLTDDHLATRSAIAVPLLRQEQAVGVLTLIHPEPNRFDKEHLDLLLSIANQAAIAIENARLYEKVTERMREATALYKVSNQLVRTLNLNQVLERVLDILQKFFGYLNCATLLVDEEAGELEVRAARGALQKAVGKARFKIGQGTVGWVAAHKTLLNVPDVNRDPRYVEVVPGTRAEIAVPMIAGDRVIGVLNVQRPEVNAFNDDDLRVLSSVAAQAAIAIERARLYSAERHLRTTITEERAKLEAIIRGASDAIFVTDERGRVLLMNPAAEQAFDVGPETWVDRPLKTVIKNANLLTLWQSHFVPDSGLDSAEIPLADGRTLYAQFTPIAGVGQMVIMRDITYLKELDRMKSEFVSTVSHDLGSPLHVILTSAELIPKFGPINQAQQEAVDDIMRMVTKTTTLVQELLDLGRIEAGVGMEVEPCQLATVINEAVEGLEERARTKGIVLQMHLPQALPLVTGNPIRLGQVVTNLVNNAIKFTPGGGTITISAREKGGEMTVEIKDTGIGIAPEDQDHIFDKFYRAKSAQASGIEGTGLGLAIVKSIVEGHDGRVWVESEPGQGSSFGFALPVFSPLSRSP